jgi:hypothetical protein
MNSLFHKTVRLLIVVSVLLTLTGCLDSDWYGGTNGVRSKLDRRISDSDYSVGWEFKYTNSGKYDVSCRPRNIFSEFGLSFWTSLELIGSEGDIKAFRGYRWRKPITLLVTPDGQAKLMESNDGDTLVYTLRRDDARHFALVHRHN